MAKPAKAKAPAPDSLTLEYDLFDLPTAQHKAGLAGMLLLIDSLKEREREPLPEVEELTATRARVRFTAASLQTLLDDWFDAEIVEIPKRSKNPKKAPKREELKEIKPKDGKAKMEKRYIYDEAVIRGNLLAHWLQQGNRNPWHKLWRDMLYRVIYAKPTTHHNFDDRAAGKPARLVSELWDDLVKSHAARSVGRISPHELTSILFLGAQSENAEQVPFKDRIEYILLLRFWALASSVFAPRIIDTHKGLLKEHGFLLAIPEVADLKRFVRRMQDYWRDLDPAPAGIRPRDALIDLPAEGGLEFLYQLARHRVEQSELESLLVAVELYHLLRPGDDVKLLACGRIQPDSTLVNRYKDLRDPRANPFFKSLHLGNLLANRPWFEGADTPLTLYPWQYFIHGAHQYPFRFFGRDARRQFDHIRERFEKDPTMETASESQLDRLARRIYQMIWAYVDHRTDERSPIKRKDLKQNEKGYNIYPDAYREARLKACSEAFLAMRGRHDSDFIEYFTGTICSVPHFLKEAEFLEVSQALLNEPLTVKNLAMLALSAHSYLPGGDSKKTSADESANS